MNTQVSQLTPAGYSCLDTIQEIVTKLGGGRETCLAIASLGNSHSDEEVLVELRHRSALLDERSETEQKCVVVPDTECADQCNQKYGDRYGVDWEYDGKTRREAFAEK